MAVTKTRTTNDSVPDFINAIENVRRRNDTFKLVQLFEETTGYPPKMFGPTIIGFGQYHYQYATGHQGDAPLAGFAPRKDSIVLYFEAAFPQRDELLDKFGKYKTGKTCVYIKSIDDIDIDILKQLIITSAAHTQSIYPSTQS